MIISYKLSRFYVFRPEVFYELGSETGGDPRIFRSGQLVSSAVADEQALLVSISGKLYSMVIDLSFGL